MRKYVGISLVSFIGIIAIGLVVYSFNTLDTHTTDSQVGATIKYSHFIVPNPLASCADAKPRMSLSWDEQSGVKGYAVFRSEDGIATSTRAIGFAPLANFTDDTAEPLHQYTYRVQDVREGGKGGSFSNETEPVMAPACAGSLSFLPLAPEAMLAYAGGYTRTSSSSKKTAAASKTIPQRSSTSYNPFTPFKTNTPAAVSAVPAPVQPQQPPITALPVVIVPPVAAAPIAPALPAASSSVVVAPKVSATTTKVVIAPAPAKTLGSGTSATKPAASTTTKPVTTPVVVVAPAPVQTPAPTPVVVPPVIIPAPTPAPVSTPAVTSGAMQWGVFAGDQNDNLAALEKLVGKQASIQAVFSGWNDPFPDYISGLCPNKTMLIFWENTGFSLDNIISGKYDAYIKSFSAGASKYGCPVMLSLFHEMNGNWDDWDGPVGNNSAAKIISAWQHVHGLVTASNIKWAWAVNNDSVPDTTANKADNYYPGDAYVDYVGVDGFNFNDPWRSFSSVFDTAIAGLQKYNKPIYIFSMGSVADSRKAAWIADGLGVQIKKYKNLAGWVWFNQNGGDGNWSINSDAASLAAFIAALP